MNHYETKHTHTQNLGEEDITVQPTVFAQMGVLEPTTDGFFLLFGDTAGNGLDDHDVFCDLGSGVGNVCLQVLLDTPCHAAVGVEVIPSRVVFARKAFELAQAEYPEALAGKSFATHRQDVTSCGPLLAAENVTVVFAHSWMFDGTLMASMTEQVGGDDGDGDAG